MKLRRKKHREASFEQPQQQASTLQKIAWQMRGNQKQIMLTWTSSSSSFGAGVLFFLAGFFFFSVLLATLG
jgi:hypothetical protein